MRYVINAVPYTQSNVGDGACQRPSLLNSIADTSIFCLPCEFTPNSRLFGDPIIGRCHPKDDGGIVTY